jgi:hypothetical protein
MTSPFLSPFPLVIPVVEPDDQNGTVEHNRAPSSRDDVPSTLVKKIYTWDTTNSRIHASWGPRQDGTMSTCNGHRLRTVSTLGEVRLLPHGQHVLRRSP